MNHQHISAYRKCGKYVSILLLTICERKTLESNYTFSSSAWHDPLTPNVTKCKMFDRYDKLRLLAFCLSQKPVSRKTAADSNVQKTRRFRYTLGTDSSRIYIEKNTCVYGCTYSKQTNDFTFGSSVLVMSTITKPHCSRGQAKQQFTRSDQLPFEISPVTD